MSMNKYELAEMREISMVIISFVTMFVVCIWTLIHLGNMLSHETDFEYCNENYVSGTGSKIQPYKDWMEYCIEKR